MRSSTDANDAHRPSQHQSGGPPAMPPRQAPSSREALESAVGAGMALPPLSVLLSVSLQGQSVLARRSPCGHTPLEAHARAQGARWMPRERLWPRAPLCCSPKLTHLSTAVPQDTVPHHLRSAGRRGRHCMAPQEGLQSSQRRWRATAARYRCGRGAVQGILAHTLRRPCPRTPRRDPSSVLCPTARASPLISIPSVAPRGERTHADGHWTRGTRCHSTPLCLARAARG